MKFLISNYSTYWRTEPFYFNAGLNLIDGVKSEIMNTNLSLYDNFDQHQPDVFITGANTIVKDLISYLEEKKHIKLLINVNDVSLENIEKLGNFFDSKNISFTFFGEQEYKFKNHNFIRITSGADTFLSYKTNIKYQIQKLIFVNEESQIVDLSGTYHYTTTNNQLGKTVDFMLPIGPLNTLFKNYDEIVFKDPVYIGSQISFNAIYSGTKVIFDIKGSSELDKIDNLFKGQKLLSSVKNKHTGLHRLKSLLSQTSNLDLAQKLEKRMSDI